MNQSLFVLFSIFLFVGLMVVPAYAQSSDSVVINEVDINPSGNDASSISEWVELYNPTDSEIHLGGWKIASTTVLKKTLIISTGTTIEPGQFLTFSYDKIWFTDSNESVELLNADDIVIDKTPNITDTLNDSTSWQRIYDGYDVSDLDGWKFVQSTINSSNGKLIESQVSDKVIVTISSDKSSYTFGQIVILEGNVSKEVVITQPFFKSEFIILDITGPDFSKTINLFPDLNLNYSTTLNLNPVLGINEGNYDVSVRYSDATASATFSVGFESVTKTIKESSSVNIITDKTQYIPGENVLITGTTSKIIPLVGMKFTVTNPEHKVIYTGNLFPIDGKFETSVFLTIVNPVYGTYEIMGQYSDHSVLTTFEVTPDIKEDVLISLWTDKEFYGLGDTVNITGRLNNYWIDAVDLNIVQSKNLALDIGNNAGGFALKISDSLRPDGNGKFNYSFTIPNDDSRLGGYLITISKDIGSVMKNIQVVEDPETFVPITDPLFVTVNKSVYDFNLDKYLIISGKITDPILRTSLDVPVVHITVFTEDGRPLETTGLPENGKYLSSGKDPIGYEFTAIPEVSGLFSINAGLERLIFSEGKYLIEAQYEEYSASTSFEIVDLLRLGDPTIYTVMEKSVYGLGETVRITGTYGLQVNDSQGMVVTVYKPGGDVDKSGTIIDGGFFSVDWTVPIQEKIVIIERDRSDTPTNLGVYRINLATGDRDVNLFFKVSLTPEDDELVIPVLSVSTSKSLYKAGETLYVEGTVNKTQQGTEGLVVLDRVDIKIIDATFPFPTIFDSSVYPDEGGNFKSNFELPITLFPTGEYSVKALYNEERITNVFSVVNDYTFGVDDPVELLVSTNSDEYLPGDVVTISGKPNRLIYFETIDVSVIQKSDNEITCGSFICGIHLGPVTAIRPSPTGTFSHNFTIPDSLSSIGSYEVTVDAEFQIKSIPFKVVEKLSTPKLKTIIEKENRISEKMIPISVKEKINNDTSIAPRVISGSLLTSRGDESTVNLKVSSSDGTCIIGSADTCLVKESTRKPGGIYDTVEVDGFRLNVRYSGPDVRLEKFSVIPEASGVFLPDATWNVEILKDDQVSRFYYKVTYKTLG